MMIGSTIIFLFSLQIFLTYAEVSTSLQNVLKANDEVISEKCNRSYTENYLIFMDASTKFIPSGISNANFYDFGKFDACYHWESKVEDEEVFGRYCLASFNLSSAQEEGMLKLSDLKIAVCSPSVCTLKEVEIVASKILNIIPIVKLDLLIVPDSCSSIPEKPGLSSGAIALIVVLSIIAAFAVCSTIYEIYLYYADKKPKNDVLLAFSIWRNGAKILSTSSNPNQLLCLNGIRALSMMWVVIGHIFSSLTSLPLDDLVDVLNFPKKESNMYILGAPISVDTFFTLGGMVTVYAFLSSMDKGVKFNLIMYYIHRYLRLTPAVAVIVFVNAYLLGYLGNGPLYPLAAEGMAPACKKYWWSSLLYIQNIVNPDEMCVVQTWYLSVDMQLFVLSPLVLLPLYHYPKYTLIFLFPFLILGGILSPALITYYFELTSSLFNNDPLKYMSNYYFQTHARFGPYVIGMLFGYVIYKMKKSGKTFYRKENHWKAALMWIAVLGGLYGCVYSIFYSHSQIGDIFVNAFHRNAWAVLVGFLVMLCVFGYGGPVDKFLSWSVFQVIAKLSYSIYIVHISFISMRYAAMRDQQHLSHIYLWWAFWADFMVCVFIAFVYCILFESPIIAIEKFIFGRNTEKKQEEKA